MGDWNLDYKEVVHWMSMFGLIDVIVNRHHGSPPPTCTRLSNQPIDAIFAPESFRCWRGGYLSFEYLEGDHRGIWCDIPVEFLLGYNMQHPAHSGARHLKTHDPLIHKKYVSTLHQILRTNNIYDPMQVLHTSMLQNVLPTDLIHFEEVDAIVTAAMQEAEKTCRKLKTGIVPWSPLYQQARDRVQYWKLESDSLQGKKVNIRKL